MPASMIPRKRLVCGDCSVSQFANKSVNTDLTATGLVLIPMIVVLVLAEQSIIGSDVAFEIGVGAWQVHRRKSEAARQEL